jgi:hypothetical protein
VLVTGQLSPYFYHVPSWIAHTLNIVAFCSSMLTLLSSEVGPHPEYTRFPATLPSTSLPLLVNFKHLHRKYNIGSTSYHGFSIHF